MIVYIASRMSGLPNYGYHHFEKVQSVLEGYGHVVINPARNFGGNQDLSYVTYIKMNIVQVMQSDGIYLFGDWRNSKGALLEKHISEMLGHKVYTWETRDHLIGNNEFEEI